MGHEVFSSDNDPRFDTHYCVDIMDFDIAKLPWKPDVIWASPPCTYFSVASIGHHWNHDNTPKSKNAQKGIDIVRKTVAIIEELQPKYWFIENPRGKLRKLGLIGGFRHTVSYCQYGDKRMKPTDIWTNSTKWRPRAMCKNGDKCHEAAPRGAKTGTQGLKGDIERSRIPSELCREILESLV